MQRFCFIIKQSEIDSGEDDYITSHGGYASEGEARERGDATARAMRASSIVFIGSHASDWSGLESMLLPELMRSVDVLERFEVKYAHEQPDDWPREQCRELQREAAMLHGVQGWNDYDH